MTSIRLHGVRQNNIKNIDIDIPMGSFTVICGPSGSGKSSLAFETLYAEGQRRYIESLSNYTKQFLNKAPKPDLDSIENIPPAIAIEQKNSVKSSRSTVGTTTEVVDYLRLIFEKTGQPICPTHRQPLVKLSVSVAAKHILQNFAGERGYILIPVTVGKTLAERKELAQKLLGQGFLRIFCPNAAESSGNAEGAIAKTKVKKSKKKTAPPENSSNADGGLQSKALLEPWTRGGDFFEISDSVLKGAIPNRETYVVVDRLAFSEAEAGRISDSISQAYAACLKNNQNMSAAWAVAYTTKGQRILIGEGNLCTECGYSSQPITGGLFSFNSPVGACPDCKGFGNLLAIDHDKVIPNPDLTIAEGAIKPFAMPSSTYEKKALFAFCRGAGIDLHLPWKDLSFENRDLIWQGRGDFAGIKGFFEYLETKKYKMHVRIFLARHKSAVTCPQCHGSRLRPEANLVLWQNKTIGNLTHLTVQDLRKFLDTADLQKNEMEIVAEPFRQLKARLKYLDDVGVGYLSLNRQTRTLSGGEFQRLNLANQLGLALSQTLYVLDEPTVGLHPRDNFRLIEILKSLQALGNTLVVVEHDADVILNSSHVIEMGPGSGHLGGEVIYNGTRDHFFASKNSMTAPYLKPNGPLAKFQHEIKPVDIEKYKYKLRLVGCSGNNLKNVTVTLPLNRMVTVTGVSGSGKSSLITHTLYPALARHVGVEYLKALPCEAIEGMEHVKNVLLIDQSPIGKTARSNPVTYLKIFDAIRTTFASTPEAKAVGASPGVFSLNVDGGRCPVCKGVGYETIDMLFMDDIEIPCDTCDGKRYQPHILEILVRGKNIHEVLNLTVAEAMDFFVSSPTIWRSLSILKEMGLEYLRLGQSAATLSGGESQRLKIVKEFSETQQKGTVYILDEPTTGLHFREVQLLIKALHKIIEGGGSVILIEHNQEVLRLSDYVIDIGPEAGDLGGSVVFEGTPAEMLKNPTTLTAKYFKEYVDRGQLL